MSARIDGRSTDAARDGIEAWVRRHQVRAWRYVRLRGCPSDLAEDLVQEAMLAAVQKRVHCESDPRSFAWLCGALDNLWRMHLRTEGRRERHVEAATAMRALELGAPADDGATGLRALHACLERLDGRARRLVDMHYVGGASREAIAKEFGMRENGVKAFLRRARSILRDCVQRRVAAERGGA